MSKAVAALKYRISEDGVNKQEALQREFKDLLRASAVIAMRRRRSTNMDETDFESSMRELITAREFDWTRSSIGNGLILLAGAAFSWGVSYFPHCKIWQDAATGISICLIAVLLGAAGLFIQFWPRWKK
jgi:hypothetical protein